MKLTPDEIAARLAEIRGDYLVSLQDKRDAIITKWSSLCHAWDADTFQSLYLILHSLAGSAETFELAGVSQAARKLVESFRGHDSQQPFSAEVVTNLQGDFGCLIASINAGLAQAEKPI